MREKHYVVIGGSKGIGLDIIRRLLDKNGHVTVVSRSTGQLPAGDTLNHLSLDILQDEIDPLAIPEIINGLAYCPGSIQLRPFNRLAPDAFRADFEVNVLGAIKAIQACLPGLKRCDTASSIVLFSTVAVQTGMPFHASIASAKGAIEGLTRSLAAELAPKVRVNAVAPSLTDTPLAKALLSDENKRSAAAQRHPLQRFGTPQDIAAAAVYLMDDASSWVTGQVMAVDGGMGALRTFK